MEANCVSLEYFLYLILFKGKELPPYTCCFGHVSNISEMSKGYQCIFSFLIPYSDTTDTRSWQGSHKPSRPSLHIAEVETEPSKMVLLIVGGRIQTQLSEPPPTPAWARSR